MKQKFILLFMVLIILGSFYFIPFGKSQAPNYCTGYYVLLEISYDADTGDFALLSKSLERGCAPKNPPIHDYIYNLTSEVGESFAIGSFNTLLFEDGIEGGEVIPVLGIFYLAVPYIPEVDNIQISYQGNIVFTESIFNAGAKYCRIK